MHAVHLHLHMCLGQTLYQFQEDYLSITRKRKNPVGSSYPNKPISIKKKKKMFKISLKDKGRKNGIVHQGLDEIHSDGVGKGISYLICSIFYYIVFSHLSSTQGGMFPSATLPMHSSPDSSSSKRQKFGYEFQMVLTFLEKPCV